MILWMPPGSSGSTPTIPSLATPCTLTSPQIFPELWKYKIPTAQLQVQLLQTASLLSQWEMMSSCPLHNPSCPLLPPSCRPNGPDLTGLFYYYCSKATRDSLIGSTFLNLSILCPSIHSYTGPFTAKFTRIRAPLPMVLKNSDPSTIDELASKKPWPTSHLPLPTPGKYGSSYIAINSSYNCCGRNIKHTPHQSSPLQPPFGYWRFTPPRNLLRLHSLEIYTLLRLLLLSHSLFHTPWGISQ